MSILLMLIGIPFLIIHYYNGGTFDELVPLASIVFLVWMLDVAVNLHAIARPIRAISDAHKFLDRAKHDIDMAKKDIKDGRQ